jgi:ABC-type antimicrobial peptide transport system permease subunit
VGIFDYLPRFFYEYPDTESSIYRFTIVGNYDLVKNFTYSSLNIAYDLIINVKEGYSASEIALSIKDNVTGTIRNVDDEYTNLTNNFKNIMMYGSANTTFLILVVIIIATTFLMIYSQVIEHEKEMNNLRILGFSPKQFFQLFVAEIIPIIIFGLLTGCLLSLFSAKITVDILTFNIDIPRYELMFPIVQTIIVIASSTVVALLTTVFTIRSIFKKETTQSRMERIANV